MWHWGSYHAEANEAVEPICQCSLRFLHLEEDDAGEVEGEPTYWYRHLLPHFVEGEGDETVAEVETKTDQSYYCLLLILRFAGASGIEVGPTSRILNQQ